MNRKLIACVLVCVLFTAADAFCGNDPNKLTFDEADYRIVKPQIVKLENGMDLYYIEDHELPIINTRIIMKGGSLFDPTGKCGLSSMAVGLMTSSGTQNMTASEIEDELDYIVSSIRSWAGQDSLSVYMNCLTENFDKTFSIMMDMLTKPAYQADRFELNKKQRIESIRRKWDYPGSIAWRHFYRIIYGESSIWGREPTVKDIESITREDLFEFHTKYINPRNAIIGIVGDFKLAEVVASFNEAFQGWKPVDSEFPPLDKVNDDIKPGVYYIEKDIEQTNMYIGHLGANERTKDRYTISLFNKVFGESFSSRLFREVREKRGLAYSVWGNLGLGKDRGTFSVGCQTKPERSIESIEVIKEQIAKIRTELVTMDEYDIARSDMINGFAFMFTTPEQSLSKFMWLDFDGVLPKDYYDTYVANIKNVTREDIMNTAATYLDPANLVIVVVGNRAKFEKELETLGPVTVIELQNDPGLKKE